jgi:hypothetical protein
MQDRPGPDPGAYGGEIAIMRAMGWSWTELQAAPCDLVDELRVRLAAEAHWTEQRRRLDAQMAGRK